MIELSGDLSFDAAVEAFLLMDDDEHELALDQMEMLLAAGEHALYLKSIQTTH